MRDVRTTPKRPTTYHTKIVDGERGQQKRRRGAHLRRAVADVIDRWEGENRDGVEGAVREFMTGQFPAQFPAEFPIYDGRYQTARPPVCDEVILTE